MMDCYFTWEPSLSKGSGKSGKNPNVHIDLLCNASFKGEESLALQNINFCARKGDLVSIQGPVGTGKSSLLHGILGEMQVLQKLCYVYVLHIMCMHVCYTYALCVCYAYVFTRDVSIWIF